MFLLLFLIIKIFFVISFSKTVALIPEEYHYFPRWLCWLMLIPGAGYVFEWILLPFALPFAIENYRPFELNLQSKRRKLFGLGLAYVIVLGISCPFLLVPFGVIPAFVLFILYWVELVNIRQYLQR